MVSLAAKYAPTLIDLEKRLEPFQPVIYSFSAGPQNNAPTYWGDKPYILIEPQPINTDETDLVVIRGEDDCTVYTQHGEEHSITFQNLLAYLAQIPRPLWSFTHD